MRLINGRTCRNFPVETMSIKLVASPIGFAFTVFVVGLLTATSSPALLAQERAEAPQLGISAEEQNLAKVIMAAPDPAAKLKAATTLIEKHPKTLIRRRIAKSLADQIGAVADASQKITLAQEYQRIFKEPSEQDLIIPALVDGYAGAGHSDEAFAMGAAFLARQPDSLGVLVALTLAGDNEVKKGNSKFVTTSIQYGAKAIGLIEAGRQPTEMSDGYWNYYKSVLPNLYQSMGLLNLNIDRAEARTKFVKAAELMPSDPFNYVMLAGLLNDEYKAEAKRYQSMPDGPGKQNEIQKVLTMLDGVIDAYAHMVALSEGKAQFQQLRQEYLQDLESYYKYRHHSTEGLQQLIDKYKITAR